VIEKRNMNFFEKAGNFITELDRIILQLDDSLWPRNWHQNVTMVLTGMLLGFASAAVTAFAIVVVIGLVMLASSA